MTIDKNITNIVDQAYQYGFTTDIASDVLKPGLSEDVVRYISAQKNEPQFMLDWRLSAYRRWLQMTPPTWAHVTYGAIDYQSIIYYAAPKEAGTNANSTSNSSSIDAAANAPPPRHAAPKSLADVDPKLLETYKKLGIPLHEHARLAGVVDADKPQGVAVDAIFDSVSVATTFKETLRQVGVIFCAFSEAMQLYPELIQQYLGSVVPAHDNFFAALNAAVFSDGSFVYIPPGVRCPMELSSYFRINTPKLGQFERTLIIADRNSRVSYLEGCTAPMYDENQLHAAVVELIAHDNAHIKYSTVQNWYPGDKEGRGGIYNFVTKRGECRGTHSKISWAQVETGSAITWKYPSTILTGDNSSSDFHSVALTANYQQADTGTKMVHIGKNTSSTIISKGISAGHGQNSYRGLVKVMPSAIGARNYTQCDSLLIGDKCGAHTFPMLDVRQSGAQVEHEASVAKISEEQLFYCQQRGLKTEDAVSMIVNGFCRSVFQELPMEFAVEAHKLMEVSLEGAMW